MRGRDRIAFRCARSARDSRRRSHRLDEFSNNVGFYRQAFVINPPAAATTAAANPSAGAAAGIADGEVAVEHVTVTPASVPAEESAVVRAGLRAVGARVDGQMVRFYAVPPDAGDLTPQEVFQQIRPFDVDILSRIRADRVHEAQAPFSSRQLGTHQILVSTIVDGEEVLVGSADLQVGTTPPPSPTRSTDRDDDEGCAISRRPASASSGTILLLIVPLLLGVRRSRRWR